LAEKLDWKGLKQFKCALVGQIKDLIRKRNKEVSSVKRSINGGGGDRNRDDNIRK
jgi:hypothetical protein